MGLNKREKPNQSSLSSSEAECSGNEQVNYRLPQTVQTFPQGWSGGAEVLSKLSVPGRPTSLDDSRARAFCVCSSCGWGLFGQFFLSSILSLLFHPLFGRRPDID